MADDLMRYLEGAEGPLAYLLVALSAALEPIFPPYPGDMVSMFAAFLAFTSTYSVVGVYLAMTLGSTGGGMVVYELGRVIGRQRARWPRILRRRRVSHGIDRTLLLFDRHGALLLGINRFWPALRAVFFLAAGMAGLPRLRVATYGGISSAAWHGLILGAGFLVEDNFEALLDLSRRYTVASTIVVVVVIAALVVIRLLLRRRTARDEDA